jgi:hypothetical protein
MPFFELRADFAEDLQLSRTRLIALAEPLEILRPVLPFDLVLHVSSVLVGTSRFRFNRRFQTTLRIAYEDLSVAVLAAREPISLLTFGRQ